MCFHQHLSQPLRFCVGLFVQRKHRKPSLPNCVPTNISPCFGIVRVVALPSFFKQDPLVDFWYVSVILESQHFLCNVLTKFHHLFVNILQKGIAGPSSYQHDCVNRAFPQIHCHGHSQSDRVCANLLLLDSKSILSNCFHSILESIDHIC
jgi:hypothetical protein